MCGSDLTFLVVQPIPSKKITIFVPMKTPNSELDIFFFQKKNSFQLPEMFKISVFLFIFVYINKL